MNSMLYILYSLVLCWMFLSFLFLGRVGIMNPLMHLPMEVFIKQLKKREKRYLIQEPAVLRLRGGCGKENDIPTSDDSDVERPMIRTPLSSKVLNKKVIQNSNGKKITKKTSGTHLNFLLTKKANCCQKKCMVDVLTSEEIEGFLKLFWDKSEEEQRGFILDFLFLNQVQTEAGKRQRYNYNIKGKSVCQEAWKLCYGISNGRFHNLKHDFETKERTCPISFRIGRPMKSRRLLAAKNWFEEYINSMADSMPDEIKKHLPSCQTKLQVYKTYVESFNSGKVGRTGTTKPLSYTQFRRMWSKDFPNVVIPKTNRFTKCGVCTLLKEHIFKIRGRQRKLTWLKQKELHLRQQSCERKRYYKHQNKAKRHPKRYLSIITDGMDQAKTNLPHFYISSKLEGQFGDFLKVHVTGVLSHGNRLSWCFLDIVRWPQDANLTINTMLLVLSIIVKKEGSLPPVLYWQMDNCFRDCKNIYILGFCALLVMAGVFRKVRLSYLMVGHTHEDVDQMFSRISATLKKKNATTLDGLRTTISGSYTPSISTVYVDNIYDVKSFIRPYTATLKHHTNPHSFRFTKNHKGEVEMSWRLWATQTEWQTITIMAEMPKGNPSILRPENKKNPTPEEMRNSVKHLSSRLSREDELWWEMFISTEESQRMAINDMTDEELMAAGKAFDLKSLQYEEPNEGDESDDEDTLKAEADIVKQINKENERPQIKLVRGPEKGRDEVPAKRKKKS